MGPPAIVGVSDKASSAGASAPATKASRAEFLASNPVMKRPSRYSGDAGKRHINAA
jgi:hypothetical protein